MSLTDDPIGVSSYNNTIFLEMSIMDITVFSNIPSTAINKVKNDVWFPFTFMSYLYYLC
jgi:hypothetical protein